MGILTYSKLVNKLIRIIWAVSVFFVDHPKMLKVGSGE